MAGFILTVIIAALLGVVINTMLQSKIQGGAGGASIAALVGAWIGAYMPYFNTFGPKFFGIAIVPSVSGAVISTLVLGFFSYTTQKSS